jgi:uncharacterized membrane protein YgcG
MVMRRHRAAAVAALTAWLAGTGCTTLQEIPRGEYERPGERKAVHLLTADSLEYEFDFTRVDKDTLTGYRRQDVEGQAPDYATLAVPLSDVKQLSTRRLDWTRTGLLGGLGAIIVASAGLAAKNNNFGGSNGSSGGGGGRVP